MKQLNRKSSIAARPKLRNIKVKTVSIKKINKSYLKDVSLMLLKLKLKDKAKEKAFEKYEKGSLLTNREVVIVFLSKSSNSQTSFAYELDQLIKENGTYLKLDKVNLLREKIGVKKVSVNKTNKVKLLINKLKYKYKKNAYHKVLDKYERGDKLADEEIIVAYILHKVGKSEQLFLSEIDKLKETYGEYLNENEVQLIKGKLK